MDQNNIQAALWYVSQKSPRSTSRSQPHIDCLMLRQPGCHVLRLCISIGCRTGPGATSGDYADRRQVLVIGQGYLTVRDAISCNIMVSWFVCIFLLQVPQSHGLSMSIISSVEMGWLRHAETLSWTAGHLGGGGGSSSTILSCSLEGQTGLRVSMVRTCRTCKISIDLLHDMFRLEFEVWMVENHGANYSNNQALPVVFADFAALSTFHVLHHIYIYHHLSTLQPTWYNSARICTAFIAVLPPFEDGGVPLCQGLGSLWWAAARPSRPSRPRGWCSCLRLGLGKRFKQRVAWKCGRDITRGRGGQDNVVLCCFYVGFFGHWKNVGLRASKSWLR